MGPGPAILFVGYNLSFQLVFLLPKARKVQAVFKEQWLLSLTNPKYQWQAHIPKAAYMTFLLALKLSMSFLEMSVWEWEAWKCQHKVHFLVLFLCGLVASRDWGSQNCMCLSRTFAKILCHPGVCRARGRNFWLMCFEIQVWSQVPHIGIFGISSHTLDYKRTCLYITGWIHGKIL